MSCQRIYRSTSTTWNFNPEKISLISQVVAAQKNRTVQGLYSSLKIDRAVHAILPNIEVSDATIEGVSRVKHCTTSSVLGTGKDNDELLYITNLTTTTRRGYNAYLKS